MRSGALTFASAGYAVFPLRAGSKQPLIRWGEGATSDLETIGAWWYRWPAASIGVPCKVNRLVVLDSDGEQGDASLRELFRYAPPIDTLTSSTGRGRHLWF